jgi:hypothetical protein
VSSVVSFPPRSALIAYGSYVSAQRSKDARDSLPTLTDQVLVWKVFGRLVYAVPHHRPRYPRSRTCLIPIRRAVGGCHRVICAVMAKISPVPPRCRRKYSRTLDDDGREETLMTFIRGRETEFATKRFRGVLVTRRER